MISYSELSDFKLISLLADGDEIAFREIYERYNSLLFIYAFRKLHDKEEARDVVQEVFAGLWNNRSNFVLKTTLSGYLYKCVLNRVLNIFRHKEFGQQYIESIQHLMDSGYIPADRMITEKDIASLIEKEIAALPPRMREVFDLRRKEYLSNKEIAIRLNISEHTVATQIKKALRVLRLKLGTLFFIVVFLYA